MALLAKEGILSLKWFPRIELVRYRRVNVQKPRAPHYERAKYLTLMKPQYKENESIYLPPAVKCKKFEEINHYKVRPDNPLEKIIAQELYEKCEASKMVCFVHANPISGEDQFQARILLRREKMELETHSKYTVQRAFQNTRYEATLPLFVSYTSIIFSEEAKVDKLLKLLKKVPQYVLLAGVVDDTLLSVSQLKKYSELRDLETARAHLVATLQSAALSLTGRLTSPSQRLLFQLHHRLSSPTEET